MCNDFRFFTPLRCVQNDRIKMLCVDRMTEYRICAAVQNDRIKLLFGSKMLCASNVNRPKAKMSYIKAAVRGLF